MLPVGVPHTGCAVTNTVGADGVASIGAVLKPDDAPDVQLPLFAVTV
ncbi:hypothetical protein [Pedobacter paludis]|nr:hypothetical protein [Pedobacter paludis]